MNKVLVELRCTKFTDNQLTVAVLADIVEGSVGGKPTKLLKISFGSTHVYFREDDGTCVYPDWGSITKDSLQDIK